MPKTMIDPVPASFDQAAASCHVRSAVFQVSAPEKLWWKNHPEPLSLRVPAELQHANDWLEHDPREGSEMAWADFQRHRAV